MFLSSPPFFFPSWWLYSLLATQNISFNQRGEIEAEFAPSHLQAASHRTLSSLSSSKLCVHEWSGIAPTNKSAYTAFSCLTLTQKDTANLASVNRPNSCSWYFNQLQDLNKTCLFPKEITGIPASLQLFNFPPWTCVNCGLGVLFVCFLRGSFQCPDTKHKIFFS